MRFRVLVLAGAVIAASFTNAAGRDPTVLTPGQTKALVDKTGRQSMVFFLAKGGANACGPGCSEWIAAEGAIDVQAGKRFQEFFETLPRRDLPVFFNSIGGHLQQASLIAIVLRANRMRAAVGRTVPEDCRADVANDAACRRLVQSKTETKARLVTKGAKCSSACSIAFAGGSVRQVAADAQFGIHSFAMASQGAGQKADEWHASHKRFFIALGVDPGFIDLINTIPFQRLRPMSRDEIARVGIETHGFYETQWLFGKKPRLSVRKSITQEEQTGSGEYRTAQLVVSCGNFSEPYLFYRREMWKDENAGAVSVRLGGSALQLTPTLRDVEKDTDSRLAKVSLDLLRKAAAEPSIEITGLFAVNGEYRPRITKVSTAGLSDELGEFAKHCVSNKPASAPLAPGQASAR